MITMKLFYVTDIHGAEICFRKFFTAIREYKIDVALLLGDLSGKVTVPIQKKEDTYTCTVLGSDLVARNATELADLQAKIANIGYYSYLASPQEVEEVYKNPEKNDELFQKLIIERLQHWMQVADEKLRSSKVQVYIGAGNDDPFSIDPVLDSSDRIRNMNERLVKIEDYEVITTAFSNPTPWNTPRECSEEELGSKIELLASKITLMENAIFNFHVPPYGTLLDVAPELKDLQPVAGSMVNVGSTAVAKAIEKYQPLIGLHGHIHESKAAQKLGRTLCMNPGSEYGEGILRGVIVNLEKGKVKNYIFTSG
jgi:Icc-related predicted phosphoesterase